MRLFEAEPARLRSWCVTASASLIALTAVAGHAAPARAPLDLDALVAEALRNHPTVQAARSHRASLRQVPSQAGSLPDPMFMAQAQNFRTDDLTLSGSPMTGLVFGLHQGLPFPGKLARRRATAERRADVADRQVGAAETDVALRVRTLYWELHYAERAQALTADSERVINTLADTVHARYGVGQGAQQDALQAEVAHSRLRAQLELRRQAVISARRALESAVGRPPTDSLPPTADPREPGRLRPRASLVRAAVRHNPELLIGGARVAAAAAAVAEARRDRYPDFGVDLGYRVRAAAPGDPSAGADMVSLGVSVSLPVWMSGKQSARVRQESLALSSEREHLGALRLAVDDQVERAIDHIERLDRQIAIYRTEVLPESAQALDASIADYQVGRVSFVSVLDNWRTQLTAGLDLERLIADRAERLAELRALVGAPVAQEKP